MFRSLVKSKKKEHMSCTTRHDKEVLVMKIIQAIHDNGGRFLKKLPNGKHAPGYHYEIADEDTAIEKTRQVFQYFRRERRDSRHVGETAATAAGTHGSCARDPTSDDSFSGLVAPQSGMIGHHGGNFDLNTYRNGAAADGTYSMSAGLPMAVLQQQAQAHRLRAFSNEVLQDLLLTSGLNSASPTCDIAHVFLALDALVPNHRESSSILQQVVQDARARALQSSVPHGLLLTSHRLNPAPSDNDQRLLALAGLSDRFGSIPRDGWRQSQQHMMGVANPHDGVLDSLRGYIDWHQFMQLLLRLPEQQTVQS
jgi:hypothetical protein